MNLNKLIWLSVGATAALFCATCAPVERPPEKEDDPVKGTGVTPEPLTQAPTPLPSGPRHRIESAIQNVRDRELLTTNGFWTIFHGILGMGFGVTLKNPDTAERVNALEYICSGGEMRGLELLPTKYGVDVRNWAGGQGVGQGHQDQFIAEMAQWGISPNKKFTVFGKDYTYMDFVRHSQMRARVNDNQELSWAILIIGQYLGTDISWTNGKGEKLHFEDLIRYELDASVEQAPCGGTHRLFGLSWCYHLHLRRGGADTGIWREIAEKTIKYRDIAKKLQNPDGTFSTDFFRERGDAADKQLRINSTGHTLEWLALALPDAELKEQWVQDAANALAMTILDMQGAPVEGGGLYHAVHGLILYHARIWDPAFLGSPETPLIPLLPRKTLAGPS